MIELNLEAKTKEQELVKAYLEENASEILADKINKGVTIEKDGKRLLNRKTLDGFMSYACEEARKEAAKGARGACIEDKTVYGWAVHYFEEDSIEGTLYHLDGTEYNPKPKCEPKAAITAAVKKKPEDKPQLSLFDFMRDESDKKSEREEPEPKQSETISETAKPEPIGNQYDQPTDEEINEILKELAEEEAKEKAETEVEAPKEEPKGSPLYQRYVKLQQTYPDAIILMRLGDFYEVYGKNAVMLAEELNMTLTSRDFGLPERVPMIGFPCHAADIYIRKIGEKHFIAVCETLDDYKLYPSEERQTVIDLETGEILSEAEMRKFDGHVEEPKELRKECNEDYSPILRALFNLLGDIFIVR